MYLRKNKVRRGDSHKTYLMIAHNVWLSGEGLKSQSRPVVIASLGKEDSVDVDLARDVVIAVESSVPRAPYVRGGGKTETLRIAQEVRRIEPFLKVLVGREFGLSNHLPSNSRRIEILEVLVRDRLANSSSVNLRDEEIANSILASLVELKERGRVTSRIEAAALS